MLILISVVLFLVAYICSHCRFVKAYRVHTVTSRPKVIPGKIFSRPRQRLWIKIADFPFRRPIACATPYLGRYSSSYGYDRTSHALPPTLCQTDCTILETDFLFLLKFFQIAFFTICWNEDDVIQQYHVTWDRLFHSCIGSFPGIHSVGMLWFEPFYLQPYLNPDTVEPCRTTQQEAVA